MNYPTEFPRVEPTTDSAIYYALARLAGLQTVAGFAIFGLYLANEMGREFAYVLIWVFAIGVFALRQVLWALGRQLDYHAKMPANQFDDLVARILALPLAILGLAVYLQWL